MLQDVRYAVRVLVRKPLVATVAAATLALGIGGASTVFSVVEAVLLRPLPFVEPDRLVRIWELTPDGDRFSFGAPAYLDLRLESRTLQRVAAYSELGVRAVLTDGGEPQHVAAIPVSASFADVLGVRPQIGRMFHEDEDRPGMAERHIVLSDGLWRRRFNADADVLGRSITLDGTTHVVTGVMPPRFDFPNGAEAWVPLAADPRSSRDDRELAVIGRLAPGATLAQLAGELRDIARRLADAHPDASAGWSAQATPFNEWIVTPRFREAVWVLFGAVGLLLLLACANIANLLLAQAFSRQAEIRVRAALGAARGRLLRQLLTESALLAVLGTGAGVLIAVWSVDAVRTFGDGRIPRLGDVQINGSVLAFACLVGAMSCFAFGLVPAMHAARVDLRSGTTDGSRHTSRSRRLRHALVVAEVALALLLLVGAGLMANSFTRLVSVDVGFNTDSVMAIPIDLPSTRYPEGQVSRFYAEALERVRAVPGVTAAGATSTNPFRQSGYSNSVTPAERAATAPASGLVRAGWRSVTPELIEAMRVPVLSGRTFRDTDQRGAERVVVISQGLADRLWPGESAVGRQIYWGGTTGRTRTVVGVVGDIRDVQLDVEPQPLLFVPHAQVDLPSMTLLVRTASAIDSVAPVLREILREMDDALPAPAIFDVGASRAAVAAEPRFNLLLLGAFAAIAFVLAVTGVYAMLAFTVSERRREIAVRLSIGASATHIARHIVHEGMGLALLGVAAGIAAAFGMTRVLSGLLYGVEPTDPATFGAAAGCLLAVVALACYLPARKASHVDPVAILRE